MLCQPSPNVSRATHQLFFESSLTSKRREPHMCVAELTSQVAWSPVVSALVAWVLVAWFPVARRQAATG